MTQENLNEIKKKPVFLKILCILTFIGAPLLIIKYIFSYIDLVDKIAQLNAFSAGFEGVSGMENIIEGSNALIKNGPVYLILLIVASVICLVGAILMLKLKKVGYYIYLIGEIAPIILPFILIKGFQTFGVFDYLIIGSSILFIVLYSLNFKRLS